MGESDERDAHDRAAILARRQRFIALTLGGLAACGGEGTPQPCLDVTGDPGPTTTTTSSGTNTTGDATTTFGDSSSSSGMPMPCLDVDPSTTSTGPGTTGDTTAADGSSDDGSGSESGSSSDTTAG